MKVLKESIFAIVRRRENINNLNKHPFSPLPEFIIQASSIPNEEEVEVLKSDFSTSQDILDRDLKNLLAQKQAHLTIPKKRVGKKMNRFSFLGLIFGLILIGGIFFISGFLICYSLYPPYGGVNFPARSNRYSPSISSSEDASAARTQIFTSVPPSDNNVEPADKSSMAVSNKSYAERQNLLKRLNNPSPQEPGLLEKAQQQVFDNIKSHFKETFVDNIQSFTKKMGEKIGPTLGGFIAPLTEDLPNQIAQDTADEIDDNLQLPSSSSPTPVVPSDQAALSSEALISSASNSKSQSADNSPPSAVRDKPIAQISILPYSLRLQRFNAKEAAFQLAQEVKKKGFDCYIVPRWVQQTLIYEVRSGFYSSFIKARQAMTSLKQQGINFSTIVMNNQNEERLKP